MGITRPRIVRLTMTLTLLSLGAAFVGSGVSRITRPSDATDAGEIRLQADPATGAREIRLRPDPTTNARRPDLQVPSVDLFGNEVINAVATYKLDATGLLYEEHSPQTEIPRLAEPRS